ncbi:DUF4380 domain-containing protein [Streptomyces sp. NP160]|uniref:DUF4380 domain-containing protein n=1 Tax=Streptomyces sp. NP160 TaxID=2586637 RepID=UPI00111ABD22|nr:DUF4380 domain-containing protein [Streptomyces sp. NP160]TNM63166.1 DUF4380 domain-containing protein [Streptomyces sp. NP160]
MTSGHQDAVCRLERQLLDDLEVLHVDTGPLQVAFLPQVGGRLISLRVGGVEVVWRNPTWLGGDLAPVRPHASWPEPDGTMGSWVNVGGGKTWPAPQGWSGPEEWAGPPDAVLDAGAYALEVDERPSGAVAVDLTSETDPVTGLQCRRRFTFTPGAAHFHQTASLTNRSDRPVRWAVWEVVQVDTRPTAAGARGTFWVPTSGEPEVHELMAVAGRPRTEPLRGGVVVPAQDAVAKLGFPTASGEVRWDRPDGAWLSLTTEVADPAVHPDGGCPVELWLQHPLPEPLAELSGLHPDAHLVEMEVLGPLVDLGPGETTTLHISWQVGQRRSEGE